MNVAVDVKLRNPQMHGQAESREALLSHGLDWAEELGFGCTEPIA
jgi:hypothetical protein